jgi:hypothetical protein
MPSRSRSDLLNWGTALLIERGYSGGGGQVHLVELAHELGCAMHPERAPGPWSRCSCAVDITIVVDAGTRNEHRIEVVRDGAPLPASTCVH